GPRIDAAGDHDGATAGKSLTKSPRVAGEAPVEADHQPPLRRRRGLFDARKFFLVQGQRLLDEDMFTGAEGPLGQIGMRVVAGGDEDEVYARILEDDLGIGADGLEAELLLRLHGRKTMRRDHRAQTHLSSP